MCALNKQTQRERETERCVRARRARPRTSRGSTGDSQKLGLGAFFKRKRSLKGSAMLLVVNTVHLHFSNYGLGQGSNRKYALR